jgi:hypothetical protein
VPTIYPELATKKRKQIGVDGIGLTTTARSASLLLLAQGLIAAISKEGDKLGHRIAP